MSVAAIYEDKWVGSEVEKGWRVACQRMGDVSKSEKGSTETQKRSQKASEVLEGEMFVEE
jgi:hypothetical protein